MLELLQEWKPGLEETVYAADGGRHLMSPRGGSSVNVCETDKGPAHAMHMHMAPRFPGRGPGKEPLGSQPLTEHPGPALCHHKVTALRSPWGFQMED